MRLRRRVRADERGIASIFEAMMTLALLTIVLAVVYEGIGSMGTAIAGGNERLVNLDEARTLMAVASKDVRTATKLVAGTAPFLLADKREVIFYANLNPIVGTPGPRKVRIYVDASTQLKEEVTPPDASSVAPNYTYLNGPTTVRFVGRYVANPTSAPIFRYYNASGVELTGVPLNATDLLAVRSVKITLSIRRTQAYNTKFTTLVNRVRMPNVDYFAAQGG